MKKNLVLLFLIYISFLSTIVKADIKTGLVADFPFSGGAIDVSGNNYRATVFGATLVEDRFGNTDSAYAFSHDKFISTNVSGDKIKTAMSISFWMRTNYRYDYGQRAYIFGTYAREGDGHSFSRYKEDNYADSLQFNLNLHDDAWHHLVINYHPDSISVYINGDYYTSKNTDLFSFKGEQFKFGKARPSNKAYYVGLLDDIKIYNRVLSSDDVWELFNENKKPPVAITPLSPKKTNPPTYIWNAISNSSWYYLWVNDSTGNKIKHWYTANQAGCPNGVGICSVKPNTTLANGSAVWWVRTWNDFGYGSWNKATRFNVSQ